jgi:hypothetical protein
LGRDAGLSHAAFTGEHERDVLDVFQRHVVSRLWWKGVLQESSMSFTISYGKS